MQIERMKTLEKMWYLFKINSKNNRTASFPYYSTVFIILGPCQKKLYNKNPGIDRHGSGLPFGRFLLFLVLLIFCYVGQKGFKMSWNWWKDRSYPTF